MVLPRVVGLMVVAALAGCERGDGTGDGEGPRRRSGASFRLAHEPVLSIGVGGGDEAHELFGVSGAARLADGSIVVGERWGLRVQRFGPTGVHLWSRGQLGDGPGDFHYVELLTPCTSARSVVAHDGYGARITVFDGDGRLVRAYPFAFQGQMPYEITCTPGGRLVFSGWGKERAAEAGPYRTAADMAFADSSLVTVLREDIPGEDRLATVGSDGTVGGDAPGIWSRRLIFAAADSGVWLGTGDDYEIEFLDWTGTTTRRIRWDGQGRTVTDEHIDAYRENLRDSVARGLDLNPNVPAALQDPRDWRVRFAEEWERNRAALPSTFPAYADLLLGDDGVLWIRDYPRPGEQGEWFTLSGDGERTRSLRLPPGARLEDIGRDWALVSWRDALDVERLAVPALVEH